MILVIDAGNSRTKWAVADGDALDPVWHAHGVFRNAELIQAVAPVEWADCTRAMVSNVAGAEVAQNLAAMLLDSDISVRWATASGCACNVSNGYAKAGQLGCDRWAAALAAWQRYRAPCIIANAGTALTVDALGLLPYKNEGVFLGGLIVPGFSLMRSSLASNTAGLTQAAGEWQDFPDNTVNALHSGALSAMAGAVSSMMDKLQRRENMPPHCILSGGDAALLAVALETQAKFANPPLIIDNLVLQGLLLMEREQV
jgi:type III pantothenate kinase